MFNHHRNQKLGLVLLLSVFLLLVNVFHIHHPILSTPLVEIHGFRQTQTAVVSKNYHKNGIDLFEAEINSYGIGKERKILLEMPIYQAFVSTLYKVFGEYTSVGRVLSLLSHLLGVFALYKILSIISKNDDFSFLTAIAYLFLPLNLIYSKAFLGDTMAISLALFGMLMLLLSFNTKNNHILSIISLLCITSSILIKPFYAPILAIPLSYYCLQKKKIKNLLKVFSVFGLAIVILFAWQTYSEQYNEVHGHSWFSLKNPSYRYWTFGDVQMRLSLDEWIHRLRLVFFVWANPLVYLVMLILLGCGLFTYIKSFLKSQFSKFILIWIITGVLYWIVIFKMLNHSYYALPLTPIISIIIAHSLTFFADAIKSKTTFSHRSIQVSIALSYCFAMSFFYLKLSGISPYGYDQYTIANKIRQNTEKDSNVLLLSKNANWSSVIPFYSERKTLSLSEDYKSHYDYPLFERDRPHYQYFAILDPENMPQLDIEESGSLIHQSDLLKLYEFDRNKL